MVESRENLCHHPLLELSIEESKPENKMSDVLQVVASPVTDVAGRLFDCVHTELTYLYNYDRNVARLRKSIDTLTSKRGDVVREVHKAEAGMEEIKEEVTTWLTEAQRAINDNNSWLNQAQHRIEATCSCCSVCFRKRSVSRSAVTRLKEMEKLCNQANGFTGAVSAGFRPPPDVEEMRCPDYLAELESLRKNREVVMEALREKDVWLIGIYGLRGVGKTALVQDINNLLRNNRKKDKQSDDDDDDVFSKVIVATVIKKEIITKRDMSSSSRMRDEDYQRVQDEIAARLGLKLGEAGSCDIVVRANILKERIQKEKRVLLVLDAVPEDFKLGHLGVHRNAAPAPNNCKIIVTTWTKDICREMDVDKTVELKRLDEEQSWTLFKRVVGDVVAKDKETHGRIIAKLCGGLPLAIVTLARSLRGNTTEEVWKEAADCMHNSQAPSMDEMMKVANEALKFSYNHLKGDLIKRCFLFCRMFPRDHQIQMSDLKAYGVGMGFLKVSEHDDLATAYNRLLAFMTKLNSACLLDYAGDDDSLHTAVTMPNAVRSMAMSVMRKEARAFRYFASPGKSIPSWPHQDIMSSGGSCYVVSLMYNSILELPSTLDSPHLQCLLLQNNPFPEIPDDYFRDALALRVLDMSNTPISSLPRTFNVLKSNLRTLCLNHCRKLSDEDLKAVARLVMLEILCLRGTNISELPKKMKNLTKLKLLDISDTANLKVVPPGVLSALISLEELYMTNSFSSWQVDPEDLQVAPFGDVASLPRLVVVEVQVEHVDFLAPQLSRFVVKSDEQHSSSKTDPKFCISVVGARPVMNSQSKSLDFNNMKKLKVSSGHALTGLLSTTQARSLKLLEELEVEDCGGMEQVIMEETAGEALDKDTFPRLKNLRLRQLPKLASFCQAGVLLDLLCLKNISVVDCPDLRSLPLGPASAPDLKSFRGNRVWFDAMEWTDSSVKARIEPFLHDG